MVDIKSLTPKELSEELAQLELPGYRHKQIFRWLHRGARSFEDMTDLPKPLRAALAERFFITSPVVERRQVSRRDGKVPVEAERRQLRRDGSYALPPRLDYLRFFAGRLPYGL
jgi:adenine C2-methylase RlmN of 23S rRNA A2503 and tRNA A37